MAEMWLVLLSEDRQEHPALSLEAWRRDGGWTAYSAGTHRCSVTLVTLKLERSNSYRGGSAFPAYFDQAGMLSISRINSAWRLVPVLRRIIFSWVRADSFVIRRFSAAVATVSPASIRSANCASEGVSP
jgi:hypothetical protein